MPKDSPDADIQLLPTELVAQEPGGELLRVLLGVGRALITLTLASVIAVFLARFKIDYDIFRLRQAISDDLAYMESEASFINQYTGLAVKLEKMSTLYEGIFQPGEQINTIIASKPTAAAITSFSIDHQVVTIEGETFSYEVVTNWWNSLREVPTLERVELTRLSRAEEKDGTKSRPEETEETEEDTLLTPKIVFTIEADMKPNQTK